MNRYIDADDFRREVWRLSASPLNEWDTWGVLNVLDRTPTADVANVIHAHKIRAHSQGGGTHWVVCSNCEKPIDWQDTYCKHCGAIMDEVE